MVSYRVQISAEAAVDIQDAADFISQDSPKNALNWASELRAVMGSLNEFPQRFGTAREGRYRGRHLRQFIHYSHRVLYTVDEREMTVTILTVIHASRNRWLR